MRYDTKIAIVVREDLPAWKKLNVTAFIAGGLTGLYPELAGDRYADADGVAYGPLIRQPVLIFAASAEGLSTARERARARGLTASIYTEQLFTTNNDADNRAAVAAVATGDLVLAGLGLHAPRSQVDKVIKGLALHD